MNGLAAATSLQSSQWIVLLLNGLLLSLSFFLLLSFLCLLCLLGVFCLLSLLRLLCLLWFLRNKILRGRCFRLGRLLLGWNLRNFSFLLRLARFYILLFTGLLFRWLLCRLSLFLLGCGGFWFSLDHFIWVLLLLILFSRNKFHFSHLCLLSCLLCLS